MGSFLWLSKGNGQLVLNELYTDPGSGKNEFFELYNTSPTGAQSVDNLTLITYFEISGQKGFYVMDLPNINVASRGHFVGSSALPFNFQGTSNTNASDFNWNSATFTTNNGFVQKWVQGTANLSDGNLYYDLASLPANFNDFLFRRTGNGASYTVFLYKAGVLVNTFIGGTGGGAAVIPELINMPQLFVDMTSTATDFTIDFSVYGSIPIEYCTQEAGSDNGYIREYDGACASWLKSSATVQHTPKAPNGTLIGYTGSVSISAVISPGTAPAGSVLNSDIVGAPNDYFPIDMYVFTDLGSSAGILDATDVYVTTNTETKLSDGPFSTTFFPYHANILIVAKTSAGCFDKILFIPNSIPLSVKLISFDGNRTGTQIRLRWETDQNEAANRFEIQKSIDGSTFITEGVVTGTGKNGPQDYTYTTPAPAAGINFYRLRVFNRNGTVSYTKTLAFDAKGICLNQLLIGTNPVKDELVLNYYTVNNQSIQVTVADMTGRILHRSNPGAKPGKNEYHIAIPGLQPGSYVANLFNGEEHYSVQFIRL